ncbi:MAG: recombinase family protein [Candidatus Gastranaerophilaceae bacterium]
MNTGKNIAYIRVSTAEQHDERQKEAVEKYGIDKFFVEKVSAKDTNRPEFQAMMEYIREDDVIYIKDFSRIARSTKDLLEIVEKLNSKNIKLISLKENLDTNTPTGKLMLTMIGAIYEFERTNLLERQKEGIAIAKRAGKYKGRKEIAPPNNFAEVYSLWKNRSITGREAMKRLNLKINTFYKLVKEWQEKEIN